MRSEQRFELPFHSSTAVRREYSGILWQRDAYALQMSMPAFRLTSPDIFCIVSVLTFFMVPSLHYLRRVGADTVLLLDHSAFLHITISGATVEPKSCMVKSTYFRSTSTGRVFSLEIPWRNIRFLEHFTRTFVEGHIIFS